MFWLYHVLRLDQNALADWISDKGGHWLSRPQNETLIPLQDFILRSCFENSIIPGYTPSFWGHECRNQGDKKSLWRKSRFFAQIVSLPFIRNHAFARNDIKGAVFKAFPAFLRAFLEMSKKKTVNLSIENAVLCLTFAFREQIRVHGGRLFFDYSEGDIGGWNRLYTQPLTVVIEPQNMLPQQMSTDTGAQKSFKSSAWRAYSPRSIFICFTGIDRLFAIEQSHCLFSSLHIEPM